MIKYATIGRGQIVELFIKAAELTGRFELSAVYSRSLEDGKVFAEKHNAQKVYTDICDLANDKDIDAVYIASPNACHPKQSEILLKSGKHIICEKPIVTESGEYNRLKALADSLNLIYMEAIIPLYTDNHKCVLDAVKEIGKIAMARIDYCQLTSRYEKLLKGEQVNIFDMSLKAGALMDLGIYCVWAAVDLLGMPNDIKAFSSFLTNGADSGGSAVFSYDDFTANVTYSKVGQGIFGTEIIGDKGAVIIEKTGLYQNAYLYKNGEKIALYSEMDKPHIMSGEADFFADFIEGKNPDYYAEVSEKCKNVHILMDQIKQSANIKYD